MNPKINGSVATDLDEPVKPIASEPKPDPAPRPADLAARRMDQLIGECIDVPMAELAKMRDEIDDLMRAMVARADTAHAFVAVLAGDAELVLRTKQSVGPAIAELRSRFEEATSRATLRVVSAGSGGGAQGPQERLVASAASQAASGTESLSAGS